MRKALVTILTVAAILTMPPSLTAPDAGIARYLRVKNSTDETVLLSRVKDGGTLVSLGRLEPGHSSNHYIGEAHELTVAQADGRRTGKLWRLTIAREKEVNDCAWTIKPGGPYFEFDCE